jgi:hypothetical protein
MCQACNSSVKLSIHIAQHHCNGFNPKATSFIPHYKKTFEVSTKAKTIF